MMNKLLEPKLPIKFGKKNPVIIGLTLMMTILPFLPWVAFTVGEGQVTAIDPNERIQTISSPVSGFISSWIVSEGAIVKKGDIIAKLQDADPSLLERFEQEKEAAQDALSSAKMMLETSRLNLVRQKKLFEQGLSARKEYEKSKIEVSKIEMEYSKALSILTKAQTQVSRQLQTIIAPRDGTIVRILPGERGQLIKIGTPIALLAPEISTLAVEIWVDGNDTSMLIKGQRAVLQFEGWPSLQIPGWPSIAIGVFPAEVFLVDAASSYNGKFRVLLTPAGKWPSATFLKPGAHAKGYITLANSYILKEIWRQLTGFPPVTTPIKDELSKLLGSKKDRE